jgi:hypothetical protein
VSVRQRARQTHSWYEDPAALRTEIREGRFTDTTSRGCKEFLLENDPAPSKPHVTWEGKESAA